MVLRPQARAPWQPAATVDAHVVEVWYQEIDAGGALVGSPIFFNTFTPPAAVSIHFATLTAAKTLRVWAMPVAADGTRGYPELRFAPSEDFPITGDSANVLAADEHVPTVTLAPTITKADGADDWIVLTRAPGDYGSTLTDGEIRVEKADDAAVFEVWPVPVSPQHRIAQKPFACIVSYRWRNQSAEDAGGGRGWSAWSPAAAAAEVGAAVPPQPVGVALATFVYDDNDSRAAVEREAIMQ